MIISDSAGEKKKKGEKNSASVEIQDLLRKLPDINLHKSPTNSHCQNFASRVTPFPLHVFKQQEQKTQAK